MNRFFKALCLILALGWLPMTQHCRLEAMGVTLVQCEHTGTDGCVGDTCGTVESASYKLTTAKMAVTAPKLVEPIFVIALPVIPALEAVEANFVPDEHARPMDWVPSWQFVRRAAPPSRAPSLSLA